MTINSYVFPSLTNTVEWCSHHLHHYVYQALVCLNATTFLHSIGRKFSSNQNAHRSLYQNKKAGISSFTLTPSFSTVLPEILGKNNLVAEDKSILLPCAKTYK
jgi:hypothetical protein